MSVASLEYNFSEQVTSSIRSEPHSSAFLCLLRVSLLTFTISDAEVSLKKYTFISLPSIDEFPEWAHPSLRLKREQETSVLEGEDIDIAEASRAL